MRIHRLIALAVLASSAAFAGSTDTASWQRDLERLDYYMAPPEGGDNKFFQTVSNLSDNTNVTLVFAANSRMNRFIKRWYDIASGPTGGGVSGCNNTYLNGLTYFMPSTVSAPAAPSSLAGTTYSKTVTYPEPIQKYAAFVPSDSATDNLSTGSLPSASNPSGTVAYSMGNWPAGTSASGTAESFAAACTRTTTNNPSGGKAADLANCQACLASNGYWINLNNPKGLSDTSVQAGAFTTNWLRFQPVKWVQLTMAYKRLVAGPILKVVREAVVVPNQSTAGLGAGLVQFMLPQSCHGNGRPQDQKLKAINGVSFASAANPIAEELFNTAWYMAGQPTTSQWTFNNGNTIPTGSGQMCAGNCGKSGPCSSCGANDFIVLFSDGRGDDANPLCNTGSAPPAWCTNSASQDKCSGSATVGLGDQLDGDSFNLFANSNAPGSTGGSLATGQFTAPGNRTTSADTCNRDVADDVTSWAYTSTVPLSTANAGERVQTYVVAIGDSSVSKYGTHGELAILRDIANSGGGSNDSHYQVASDFASLEKAISKTFSAISTGSTSFSAAAITTVQTQGFTSTFIPRFSPAPGSQWNGQLERFNLFNEFSSGCTSADYNTKNARNPNGNSSCFDVYLTDADGGFVQEVNGTFVRLDNTAAWDGGWPVLSTLPDGGGQIPANPFWEASDVLTKRENAAIADGGATVGSSPSERVIYTVAPSASNDGTYSSTLISFNTANAATIAPLLKLGGPNGEICTQLAAFTRHTYSTSADCAVDVIAFTHGRDVLSQNANNRAALPDGGLRTVMLARPNILGDIFHSTPVLVTPPAPTYLCDLGVINQCVPSLYSTTLETGGDTAYQSYLTTNQYRTEFVLVGSNDGMLHAFNAGNDQTVGTAHSFDLGTGDEMWAFIPPEMLPKLARYVIDDTHNLLVDGSPMVRDVWVDGSCTGCTVNNVKEAGEFHTVAVIGDREGGRHYTALDVTDPANPKFLWTWPKGGTTEGLAEGGSWNDLGPSPAPIGPIAEVDNSGPFKVNGVKAHERYIVAVGGGFDPTFIRGRSVHMLDVWTGTEVYRFAREDSAASSDPRQYLGEVVAPVSMIDSNADGLFDTAVVGDTYGQMWTISMLAPASPSGGLYTNWYGGRGFIQYKGDKFAKVSPFFQRASAALLGSGAIRVYLAAGDRYQIKDPNGGTCSLADLSACVRKGCTVSVNSSTYDVGGSAALSATGSFSVAANATSPASSSSATSPTPGSVTSTAAANAQINWQITCNGTTVNPDAGVACTWNGSIDGGADCPNALSRPDVSFDYNPSIEDSRFYSVRLFGSGSRSSFSTSAGAVAYDQAALTDRYPDGGSDLVYVGGGTTASGSVSSDIGNGWFVVHDHSSDEKSSSAPLLLGGCVTWKTLVPNSDAGTTCGGFPPLDTAYFYQADISTGAISCGVAGSDTYKATVRSTASSTYVAPQSPSPVVSVNAATGQVAYGSVSLDPGTPPTAVTIGTNDVVAPIQWLEVPRKVHDCRHDGTNCK